MDLVSIIIPTFNEADSIVPLIKAILDQGKSIHQKLEIIVVDDNSPDKTAKLVSSHIQKHDLQQSVRLIIRTTQPGLGNSILAGVLEAKGSIIIGMDADFNHDPVSLPHLLKALETSDLAVASRFVPGGGMNKYHLWLFSKVANSLFQLMGMPITDNTSGYYAIHKKQLFSLGPKKIYYGYGDYHLRLVGLAHKKGLTIKEIPTYYLERRGGKSKSVLLKMFVSYIKEVWRLRG